MRRRLAFFAAGLAVALNWRGVARRYADIVDAWVPSVRWQKPGSADEPRFVVVNRVIFAGLAVFGLVLLLGCLVSVVRQA